VPIRKLAPTVAARIAAGEVIDRPSAVVKELVENAIDAGACRITIDTVDGGASLIEVADDGHGIPGAELALAFERHATSKLADEADLDRIGTLGFRGEALPSIAAVADVDIRTRHADDAHGWLLQLRGGTPSAAVPIARARGTTITVRELFADMPARRKFLRGRSSEGGQIATILSNVCLAYPGISFALTLDGRPSLQTEGSGELIDVVRSVHGAEIAAEMVPIEPVVTPAVEVRGCISNGRATLPTRAGITILVNGRWVSHRALGFAIDEAYRTAVTVGRFPVVVLDIKVPPADVDVNVHPRKSEVRLLRERTVFACVQSAVQETLRQAHAEATHGVGVGLGEGEDHEHAMWVEGLRVLGQVGATYIIAEGRQGLYLVDQHAAHERVLLEQLRETWGRRTERQVLLEPAVVNVAPRHAAVVHEHVGALAEAGFDVEPFGRDALLVRSVPASLAHRNPLATLASAVTAVCEETTAADWRERFAIVLSCHSAVRAGDRLSTEEMEALLVQLGETELCGACSHGRPTAVLVSHKQLEREFGRDYR
jgi:DNA mismatch repair protein MutL